MNARDVPSVCFLTVVRRCFIDRGSPCSEGANLIPQRHHPSTVSKQGLSMFFDLLAIKLMRLDLNWLSLFAKRRERGENCGERGKLQAGKRAAESKQTSTAHAKHTRDC
jgi:hypothetical protein